MRKVQIFQSTLSARRATVMPYFNLLYKSISIHALREESDQGLYYNYFLHCWFQSTLSARRATHTSTDSGHSFSFQSTLSARRATQQFCLLYRYNYISIHALREESDIFKITSVTLIVNFNPRSPRGERQVMPYFNLLYKSISIHALREESDVMEIISCLENLCISIHALREESDSFQRFQCSQSRGFQSTLSARRATW